MLAYQGLHVVALAFENELNSRQTPKNGRGVLEAPSHKFREQGLNMAFFVRAKAEQEGV